MTAEPPGPSRPAAAARRGLIVRHGPTVLLFAYLAVVLSGLLFFNAGTPERDAFFHARLAQLLPERGLDRHFPWMRFTAWRDHFADKDFLYHLALAAFCRDALEPLPGAKVATLLLALGALAAFHLVLLRLRVPWPLLWTAMLVSGGGLFLSRLILPRSHLASILLMQLLTLALLERRSRACLALGALYAWTYSVPLVALVPAATIALGWRTTGPVRRLLRPFLATAAGVAVGLVIHPYVPDNLPTLWVHLRAALASATGGPVQLGAELEPLSALRVLAQAPGALLALGAAIGGAVWLAFRRPATGGPSAQAMAMLATAATWFAAMLLAQRAAEYAVPAAVMAAALVARDLRDRERGAASSPAGRPRSLAALAAAVVLLGVGHDLSVKQVRRLVFANPPFPSEATWRRNRYFDGAAAWMRANLPAGSTIVNLWWDDFPELFYSAPEMSYVVGLDPTFLREFDPRRSELLEGMRSGRLPLDLPALARAFDGTALVLRYDRARLYPELYGGAVRTLYRDELAVLVDLRTGGRTSP